MTMPCIDMIGTGRNIEDMCKAHGMTTTQMADRIGVTPVAVFKWKTGRNMPTIDNFIAMAGIFGVKVDDIIKIRMI